jgi:diacylglycerol kinase
VETLNTALEMLCDHIHPHPDLTIGKVKNVAAGA